MMIARKKAIFAAEHSTTGKRLPPVAIRHLEHGAISGSYDDNLKLNFVTYEDQSALRYSEGYSEILYRSAHGSYRDIRAELAKQEGRINQYLLWGAIAAVVIVALWWAI